MLKQNTLLQLVVQIKQSTKDNLEVIHHKQHTFIKISCDKFAITL